ncbi:MAG: type II toxin-antitoxin system VapB family antitoxin [Candidatus Dormibacteraceae bacterium]
MSRTNIDIDNRACGIVMNRFGLRTKREAVNFALRELSVQLDVESARKLMGSGWDADLAELRESRPANL